MRKVIANEWMTLDGVVQAPSYADEDVTGGFGHGGWHTRFLDDLSMNWVIENMRSAGGYLLGRGAETDYGAFRTVKASDAEHHEGQRIHAAACDAWRPDVAAAKWQAIAGNTLGLAIQGRSSPYSPPVASGSPREPSA